MAEKMIKAAPPPMRPERSPFERMADFTRRILVVKKTELRKPKKRKRT